jgi:hypothetical protein
LPTPKKSNFGDGKTFFLRLEIFDRTIQNWCPYLFFKPATFKLPRTDRQIVISPNFIQVLFFISGTDGPLWQLPRGFFCECEAFFKNAWYFKDIFREFEAFLKISILFEDIFREIEAFLINVSIF